jgi:hypothetical protein
LRSLQSLHFFFDIPNSLHRLFEAGMLDFAGLDHSEGGLAQTNPEVIEVTPQRATSQARVGFVPQALDAVSQRALKLVAQRLDAWLHEVAEVL